MNNKIKISIIIFVILLITIGFYYKNNKNISLSGKKICSREGNFSFKINSNQYKEIREDISSPYTKLGVASDFIHGEGETIFKIITEKYTAKNLFPSLSYDEKEYDLGMIIIPTKETIHGFRMINTPEFDKYTKIINVSPNSYYAIICSTGEFGNYIISETLIVKMPKESGYEFALFNINSSEITDINNSAPTNEQIKNAIEIAGKNYKNNQKFKESMEIVKTFDLCSE